MENLVYMYMYKVSWGSQIPCTCISGVLSDSIICNWPSMYPIDADLVICR